MRMINPLFWCCAYEDIKFKFNTKITISIQIIFKYGINFKFYLIFLDFITKLFNY